MPLPASSGRTLVHTRRIDITIHRRDDALWDVDGRLVDEKPFRYPMVDGVREPGEPVHDLSIRLTVDGTGVVHDVLVVMDQGAHGPCPEVGPAFGCLVGTRIGPGWNREVRRRLGGPGGCTHLVELLPQLATAFLQALWAEREMAARERGEPADLEPGVIDSCYTYRADGEYVRVHFPRHHRSPGQAERGSVPVSGPEGDSRGGDSGADEGLAGGGGRRSGDPTRTPA